MIDMNGQRLDTLPPLPYVAHEILVALNDSKASLSEIARSLGREPGLAARIVSMANSAFFADQRPLYDIEDALVRLGIERVRVLSASVLLAKQFDSRRCKPFRTDRYWYDAVGTAVCSAHASRYLSSVPKDLAYLAGLLHNIGLLLLVHVFPLEMSDVLSEHAADPDSSLPALTRKALGIDHHTSGRLLLSEWGLGDAIGAVAEHAHDRHYRGPHAELVNMVRICSEWTSTGFSCVPPDAGSVFSAAAIAAIGQACQREHDQLEGFARLLAQT